MLRPIPPQILKKTVTFSVSEGVDMWQKPKHTEIQVSRTCLQPSHETRKTKNNTEVVLRSLLFVDARLSQPAGIDLEALQIRSEQNGEPLRMKCGNNIYTVLTVDTLYDDTGILHHTEVGLV